VGVKKIPTPMIAPMTTQVASTNPSTRGGAASTLIGSVVSNGRHYTEDRSR